MPARPVCARSRNDDTDARDAHTKISAGWRPLFTGTLFGPERTVRAGVACLLIDLAVAGYFVELRGAAILWFALAGGLIAVFFTPLMLRGLKEPVESGILLIVGYGITITLQSRLPSDRHSVATTMLLEVK